MSQPLDYKELLKKYMCHVAEDNGTDFTSSLNSQDNETSFTAEEVEYLEQLSKEKWDE